jgi:hypothetical protein
MSTPEAASELIEREIPELSELAHLARVQKTHLATLVCCQTSIHSKNLMFNLSVFDINVVLKTVLPPFNLVAYLFE